MIIEEASKMMEGPHLGGQVSFFRGVLWDLFFKARSCCEDLRKPQSHVSPSSSLPLVPKLLGLWSHWLE